LKIVLILAVPIWQLLPVWPCGDWSMTEFDLVPREYRMRLALHQWLRRLGTIVAGAVIVAAASGAALAFANNNLDSAIEELQTKHAMTSQQRNQLETLDSLISELRQQWQLLTTLRSGAPAEQVFTVIDSALGDTPVWFEDWAFVREGAAERAAPATVNTGYFIVVPDGQDAEEEPAWQIETHVKINGQARDHAALSSFVRSLFQRNEVRDVRVQRTTLHRYAKANVVDFQLAIFLNGNGVEE
jgi:hypothetical protein